MIEFVERVGAEPKVFSGVGLTVMEDNPEEKDKKRKKEDKDGDTPFGKAPEQQESAPDEENVPD